MKYLTNEVIKNIKLKSCPFCGSEAEIDERYNSDEGYSLRVGCPECFLQDYKEPLV